MAGRVGFERLRQAAQAKKFDILLVEEMSRFSRDFLGGFAKRKITSTELKGESYTY